MVLSNSLTVDKHMCFFDSLFTGVYYEFFLSVELCTISETCHFIKLL